MARQGLTQEHTQNSDARQQSLLPMYSQELLAWEVHQVLQKQHVCTDRSDYGD